MSRWPLASPPLRSSWATLSRARRSLAPYAAAAAAVAASKRPPDARPRPHPATRGAARPAAAAAAGARGDRVRLARLRPPAAHGAAVRGARGLPASPRVPPDARERAAAGPVPVAECVAGFRSPALLVASLTQRRALNTSATQVLPASAAAQRVRVLLRLDIWR